MIMVLFAQLCEGTLKNECILCQLYLSNSSTAAPVSHVVLRMSQSTLSWLLCHQHFPFAASTGLDQRRAGGTLLEVEAVPCGLSSHFLLPALTSCSCWGQAWRRQWRSAPGGHPHLAILASLPGHPLTVVPGHGYCPAQVLCHPAGKQAPNSLCHLPASVPLYLEARDRSGSPSSKPALAWATRGPLCPAVGWKCSSSRSPESQPWGRRPSPFCLPGAFPVSPRATSAFSS